MTNKEKDILIKYPEKSVETPKKDVILIIDDEKAIGKIIKRMLESKNDNANCLEVDWVNSPIIAIQKFEFGFNPDIIFCDIIMPEMTGVDFYEWLKKERPDLIERTYFMTGGANGERNEKFIKKIQNEGRLLEKPFDINRIRELAQKILD